MAIAADGFQNVNCCNRRLLTGRAHPMQPAEAGRKLLHTIPPSSVTLTARWHGSRADQHHAGKL